VRYASCCSNEEPGSTSGEAAGLSGGTSGEAGVRGPGGAGRAGLKDRGSSSGEAGLRVSRSSVARLDRAFCGAGGMRWPGSNAYNTRCASTARHGATGNQSVSQSVITTLLPTEHMAHIYTGNRADNLPGGTTQDHALFWEGGRYKTRLGRTPRAKLDNKPEPRLPPKIGSRTHAVRAAGWLLR
jgi:hypothetical protein